MFETTTKHVETGVLSTGPLESSHKVGYLGDFRLSRRIYQLNTTSPSFYMASMPTATVKLQHDGYSILELTSPAQERKP